MDDNSTNQTQNANPQDILSLITQWATNNGQGSQAPQTASNNAGQTLGGLINNAMTNNGQGSLNSVPSQKQWLGTSTPITAPQNQQMSQPAPSQQALQQAVQKAHTQKLQNAAQQLPVSILGNMLDSWSGNGGTQAPYATPQNAPSPAQAAQSATGIVNQPQQPVAEQKTSQQPAGGKNPPQQPNSAPTSNVDVNSNKSIYDQINDNVNKRLLELSKNPSNWWNHSVQAEEIDNLKNIQDLVGGKPLDKTKIAEMTAQTYSATIGALKDAASAQTSKLSALASAYSAEEQTKGPVATMMHKESPNQAVLRQQLEREADDFRTTIGNLKTLREHAPQFNQKGVDKQASAISGNIKDKIAMARKAGYSDKEINDYLSGANK